VPRGPAPGSLDHAAAWLLATLQRLLRRGPHPDLLAREWVDEFDGLLEQARAVRASKDDPAQACPLVSVSMPVDVRAWPGKNEALPVEQEHRVLAAIDNRRLVGKVAEVLLDNIALQRQAAVEARRRNSDDAEKYATQTQLLGRQALRGVDLDALAQAVAVEAARPAQAVPPNAAEPEGVGVEFPSAKLAIVAEGRVRQEIRGERRVWLLRQVLEAGSRGITWGELMQIDMDIVAAKLAGRRMPASTPRMATNPSSLQRLGRRVHDALGKLQYLWEQDGRGARWADDKA
jgi:hypothetical protein